MIEATLPAQDPPVGDLTQQAELGVEREAAFSPFAPNEVSAVMPAIHVPGESRQRRLKLDLRIHLRKQCVEIAQVYASITRNTVRQAGVSTVALSRAPDRG